MAKEMIALRKQRYGKKNLATGDRFMVHSSHVAVMEVAGLARVAPPPEPVKRAYSERKAPVVPVVPVVVAVAEPETAAETPQEEAKPKRAYQRKDMTAASE